MKSKNILFTIIIFAIIFTISSFGQDQMMKSHTSNSPKSGTQGKVVKTMNSGGYTYCEIQEGETTFWAAARQFPIKVGDIVVYKGGMTMKNFKSKTLDRTFETIIFFTYLKKAGSQPDSYNLQTPLPKGHQPIGQLPSKKKSVMVKPGSIQKAKNGFTVSECFLKIDQLKGTKILIRGIVVKISRAIMKKNWIHLQDGTGKTGQNDLVVTTTHNEVKTGDQVLIQGLLSADRDFGSGYKYDVIVEDASVTVEKSDDKGEKK